MERDEESHTFNTFKESNTFNTFKSEIGMTNTSDSTKWI